MKFSERVKAEGEFLHWAAKNNVEVCGAQGVFVWLMTTDEGKEVLKKLCAAN